REEEGEYREKMKKLQMRVVKELIETERDYLRDLELFLEWFEKPLRQQGILSDETRSFLFSDFPLIHKINCEFFSLLPGNSNSSSYNLREEEKNVEFLVGTAFLTVLEDFTVIYKQFC